MLRGRSCPRRTPTNCAVPNKIRSVPIGFDDCQLREQVQAQKVTKLAAILALFVGVKKPAAKTRDRSNGHRTGIDDELMPDGPSPASLARATGKPLRVFLLGARDQIGQFGPVEPNTETPTSGRKSDLFRLGYQNSAAGRLGKIQRVVFVSGFVPRGTRGKARYAGIHQQLRQPLRNDNFIGDSCRYVFISRKFAKIQPEVTRLRRACSASWTGRCIVVNCAALFAIRLEVGRRNKLKEACGS